MGLSLSVVRRRQVGMIREVVRLGTELEAILPEHREGLDQRDIPIHQAGRVKIVANAALKIKRSGRGRSKEWSSGASGGCKPLGAASSASRAGKFAQVFHPSFL